MGKHVRSNEHIRSRWWIARRDRKVSRRTFILGSILCAGFAALHLPYAIYGNVPLFSWGAVLFLVAVGTLCVPTALLGGHHVPGPRLAGLCLTVAAAGCIAVAAARWVEPVVLDGTRRTQYFVYTAPVFALLFLSAGCYLLWQRHQRKTVSA